MEFWYGVSATVALYLFCRWIAFVAPLGDPETGAGRCEPELPWRLRQYGSNPPPPQSEKPPPPPGPPSRAINDLRGETKQSIRDRQDYETYMAGFSHGVAVVRSNT